MMERKKINIDLSNACNVLEVSTKKLEIIDTPNSNKYFIKVGYLNSIDNFVYKTEYECEIVYEFDDNFKVTFIMTKFKELNYDKLDYYMLTKNEMIKLLSSVYNNIKFKN